MQIIDILIIATLVLASIRGYEVGMARQLFSTAGFLLGLTAGVHAASYTNNLAPASTNSVLSLVLILGLSFIGMSCGEFLAIKIQRRRVHASTKWADGIAGATLSVATTLVGVWFGSVIVSLNGGTGVLNQLNNSRVISSMYATMPPASQFLSVLSSVIEQQPAQVFTGDEPSPEATYPKPPLSTFKPVVARVESATFKIEGIGCGGLMDGTGFAIAPDYIVTNAHVVAGVSRPRIIQNNHTHSATIVWFSPQHDLAVLYVPRLSAAALPLSSKETTPGLPLLLIGYPKGGNRQAQTAVALGTIRAKGQDIYNQEETLRRVLSLQANVVQGNSGGAVVNTQGEVVGIVFATSTTYNNIGYALASEAVRKDVLWAITTTKPLATQPCVSERK